MNQTEQSIIQGQRISKFRFIYNYGWKRYLRELFCKHQYQISIVFGLGLFESRPRMAVTKDGAEITCYCDKCYKEFIKVISTSDGKISKKGL